ncbi:MAG: heavy-metal-associated domain-containing protein [Candidatus Kapaibacterium sp.]
MAKIKFLALFMLPLFLLYAAEAGDTETVKIKTSAQCEMCKERIEKELPKTDGVEEAKLILRNAMLYVEYDVEKTNPDKVRQSVADIGYDADDVKADKEAYSELPRCCQKPEDR